METQYATHQEQVISRARQSSQGSYTSASQQSLINKSLNFGQRSAKAAKVSEIVDQISMNNRLLSQQGNSTPTNWQGFMNSTQASASDHTNILNNHLNTVNQNNIINNSQLSHPLNIETEERNFGFSQKTTGLSQLYSNNSTSELKACLSTYTDSVKESGLQATSYVLAQEVERQSVQLDEKEKMNTSLRTSNSQLCGINGSLIQKVQTSEAAVRDLEQKIDLYERNILLLDQQIGSIEENSSKTIKHLEDQLLREKQDKQKSAEEAMQKLTQTFLTQQKAQEAVIQDLEQLVRKNTQIQAEQETKNQSLQNALKYIQDKYDRLEVVCQEGAHLEKENRLLHQELNKRLEQKNIEQENDELRQQLNLKCSELNSLKEVEKTLSTTQKELKKMEQLSDGLKTAVVELDEKNKKQTYQLRENAEKISGLEAELAQSKEDNHVLKVSLHANHKECEELFNDYKFMRKSRVGQLRADTIYIK